MAASSETASGPSADVLLRTLAEATAGVAGEAFLGALVRSLAGCLEADGAFVAELIAPERVRVLASAGAPAAGTELDVADAGGELVLPLVGARGPIGRIGVRAAHRLAVGEEALAVLRIFAARAAAEVERHQGEAALREREAQLTASRARVVQAGDEERRRIGRDLHDGAQQRLVALGQFVDVARRKLERGDAEEAARLLALAREQIGEAGAELRALARGLHPVALDRGLEPALASLAMQSTLALDVVALPDRRLPEVVEATIWFLVAEALSNAVKHAGATTVRVGVALEGRTVRATVADDGAGGADAEAGTGLRGLAARVEALGGELGVESPAGAGTTLTATIPLTPWRTPREPFLQFGHEGDGGLGEQLLGEVLAGERSAAISLAREWDLEGGPPRPGAQLPVLDHEGRRRAVVEVTRVAVLRFDEIDDGVIATQGPQPVPMEEWHERQRRLYAVTREDTALLLGEPGWHLTGAEPMAVVHFRLAG